MIDYIDSYKKHLISQKKYSNYTIATYCKHVNKFISWYNCIYKNVQLQNIDSIAINKYQQFLKSEKLYSDSGVRIRIFSVLSFCKFLFVSGLINNPIVLEVIPLDRPNISLNIPTDYEISTFKNEVYKNNNVRDIAIIELLLNTGIQYNELLALRKKDIEITENNSMIKINKRNQSRMITLNTVAKKALLLYKNTLNDDNILWLGKASSLTRDGINKMIKRYAKKVGLSDKITPNSLIQYFASTLAQKKVLDAKTFANILGYKNTNIINRYIEPNQANVQDIIENIYA